MKSFMAKKESCDRKWLLVDADSAVLGRLAVKLATILMGKNKPTYTPNVDTGDFVVVINAEKVRVTGDKAKQKMYYRHSGYPGGFKVTSYEKLMATHPTRVIEHAVKGMLPHTRLGAQMIKKLRVYAGDKHPHLSQVGPAKAATGEKA